MQFTTEGLVLREQATGESDRVVTLLTRTNGIIRAFAKGTRKLRSRNAAATQVFCYSRFVLFKGRSAYTIDEAETIQMFFGLRREIEKLALAQYFCELALALAPEEDEAQEFLRLFTNGLYYLENGKRPVNIIKPAVEMRSLSLAGYQPNLIGCESCGTFEGGRMFFRLKQGALLCGDCYKADGLFTMELNRSVLSALRHTVYAPFEKLFSFELPERDAALLAESAESYLVSQLERNFKTLHFYHQIP